MKPFVVGALLAAALAAGPGLRALDSCGDLNADGQVNITDATIALRVAVGLTPATPALLQGADFKGSGKIDLADVTLILQRAVGIVPSLAGRCRGGAGGPGLTTVVGDPNAMANGRLIATRFQTPSAIALDAQGDLIVADLSNYALRMITPQGLVSTLVGNGVEGFQDGPASQALLGEVWGLRVAPDGTIYFTDATNERLRKLSADHSTVTTVAGDPPLDAAGRPQEADKDGPGNVAQFAFPAGVAIDASGNVFIADSDNNMIRKVAPDGTVTTAAGSGQFDYAEGAAATAAFRSPWGLAFDKNGTLYISDSMNELIRTLSPQGEVGSFSGNPDASSGSPLPGFQDGSATTAQFGSPLGLSFGGSTLYVTDDDIFFREPTYSNSRIRAIDPTGAVTTIAGSDQLGLFDGKGTAAGFWEPLDLAATPDGTLYVADSYDDAIRKIDPHGNVTTVAGRPSAGFADGPASQARLYSPTFLATDGKGTLYIADQGNNRIRKLSSDGKVVTVLGNDRVNGVGGLKDGPVATALVDGPSSIAVAQDGSLYFTDEFNNAVRKLDPTGKVTTVAGTGTPGFKDGPGAQAQFNDPQYLQFGPDGALYVSDSGNFRVRRIAADGAVSTVAGSATSGSMDGPAAMAQFGSPGGLAIAADGTIYVADETNEEIRKIDPKGSVTTLSGNPTLDANKQPQGGFKDGSGLDAQFDQPTGLLLMPDGSVLVTDRNNSRIRKVAPDGTTTTVAGLDFGGFWDGPPSVGRLSYPYGLALDADGSVLIADSGNNRVRRLRL